MLLLPLAASLLSAATTPVFPGSVPVFYGGLNGSKCFRIPTIIKTSQNTLLAFAENRVTDCGDNGPHHALVLRRSSDDGVSWGPMSTVVEGTTPCPGCPAAISNPNPLEVTLKDGSKAILLHYDTMNNPSVKKHGKDMQLWSFDDGNTWVDKSVLSYPPEENLGALIGPSVGLQADDGTLYYSACQTDGSGHFLYWSRDFGKSWTSSKGIRGLGECSIAFLVDAKDGRIIMDCRTGAGPRSQVIWAANGTQLSAVTKPAFHYGPGCQGSIVNSAGTLYVSNPNTTHGRTHMAVKYSQDRGASWHGLTNVWAGPSGYSQLVPLGSTTATAKSSSGAAAGSGGELGLLFEAGQHGTYETISFVKIQPKKKP